MVKVFSNKDDAKYIFFIPESMSRYGMNLFSDLEKHSECKLIVNWGSSNFFAKAFRRIVLFIQGITHNEIIKKLNSHVMVKEKTVIFVNAYLNLCEHEYLDRLRMNGNKIILLLIDSISVQSPAMEERDFILSYKWDAVFSYDLSDCQKYNWKYIGFNVYSNIINKRKTTVDKDAYFVGGLKGGRDSKIFDLYYDMMKHDVKIQFDIYTCGLKNNQKNLPSCKISNIYFSYQKHILNEIRSTNCIIEILQENQIQPTRRWFEAICLNKKLLTNNKNAVSFPYYNEKYVKIFDSLDDIDYDWIRKREVVDYGYKGEFSPTHLLPILDEI